MFITFFGGMLIMLGAAALNASYVGGISRYYAHETAPAIARNSEAMAEGLRRAGGLKINIESRDLTSSTQVREVVKVKCRACGYLETEDATFCSKCGGRV